MKRCQSRAAEQDRGGEPEMKARSDTGVERIARRRTSFRDCKVEHVEAASDVTVN